jgi:Tol biopolymer transport system component
VTPQPLEAINSYAFSPDVQEILVSAGLEEAGAILVAKADGSSIRPLDVGSLVAIDPIYRAPDGREVIFVGHAAGRATADGLYAVRADGSDLRPIVAPTNLFMLGPISSPDGTQIAYNAVPTDYETANSGLLRVFIVAADGGTPRILRDLSSVDDLESVAAWSNDGKRLVISGCYRSEAGVEDCPSTMEVVPVGGGPVVRLDFAGGFPGLDGTQSTWAPDDRSIVTTPADAQGVPVGTPLSWDPLTGRSSSAPWTGTSAPSWQRLAP